MKDKYRPTYFGDRWLWHNADKCESAGIAKCGRLPSEIFCRLGGSLPVQMQSDGIVKAYPTFGAAMRELELAHDRGD